MWGGSRREPSLGDPHTSYTMAQAVIFFPKNQRGCFGASAERATKSLPPWASSRRGAALVPGCPRIEQAPGHRRPAGGWNGTLLGDSFSQQFSLSAVQSLSSSVSQQFSLSAVQSLSTARAVVQNMCGLPKRTLIPRKEHFVAPNSIWSPSGDRRSLPVQSDGSHTSEATDAINQVWDDNQASFWRLERHTHRRHIAQSVLGGSFSRRFSRRRHASWLQTPAGVAQSGTMRAPFSGGAPPSTTGAALLAYSLGGTATIGAGGLFYRAAAACSPCVSPFVVDWTGTPFSRPKSSAHCSQQVSCSKRSRNTSRPRAPMLRRCSGFW